MKTIINGIINENPTFVLLLGLCPVLAVTTKFENSYIMGISVLFILIFSNIIISLIKKIVPDNVRIPVYIMIIGTFVTTVEMLLNSYLPDIHNILGIYLPLLVVNCIIFGRALSFASKNSVGKSFLDAIGIGLGFMFAISLIGFIRELLGTNTITLMDGLSDLTGYQAVYKILPDTNILPISILVTPAGAFLVLGLVIALFNYIKVRKEGAKHESN